jgi:hypothetical protein
MKKSSHLFNIEGAKRGGPTGALYASIAPVAGVTSMQSVSLHLLHFKP